MAPPSGQRPCDGNQSLARQNGISSGSAPASIGCGATPKAPVTRPGKYPSDGHTPPKCTNPPNAPRRRSPYDNLRWRYEAGSFRSDAATERFDDEDVHTLLHRTGRSRRCRPFGNLRHLASQDLAVEFYGHYTDAIARDDRFLIQQFEGILDYLDFRHRPPPTSGYRSSSAHTYRVREGDNIYSPAAAAADVGVIAGAVTAARRQLGGARRLAVEVRAFFGMLARRMGRERDPSLF